MSNEIERDWYVFSTAVVDKVLILNCKKTGANGIVRNPSKKEWSDAYYAPSSPYQWLENDRVEII